MESLFAQSSGASARSPIPHYLNGETVPSISDGPPPKRGNHDARFTQRQVAPTQRHDDHRYNRCLRIRDPSDVRPDPFCFQRAILVSVTFRQRLSFLF